MLLEGRAPGPVVGRSCVRTAASGRASGRIKFRTVDRFCSPRSAGTGERVPHRTGTSDGLVELDLAGLPPCSLLVFPHPRPFGSFQLFALALDLVKLLVHCFHDELERVAVVARHLIECCPVQDYPIADDPGDARAVMDVSCCGRSHACTNRSSQPSGGVAESWKGTSYSALRCDPSIRGVPISSSIAPMIRIGCLAVGFGSASRGVGPPAVPALGGTLEGELDVRTGRLRGAGPSGGGPLRSPRRVLTNSSKSLPWPGPRKSIVLLSASQLGQRTLMIAGAERGDELGLVVPGEELPGHDVAHAADAARAAFRLRLVRGRANDHDEVALPDRLFHERRKLIAGMHLPLVEDDVHTLVAQLGRELTNPGLVGVVLPA